MYEKIESYFLPMRPLRKGPGEVVCALCDGELMPGDRYFLLGGEKICEICLEYYAKRYFEDDLRQVSGQPGGDEP